MTIKLKLLGDINKQLRGGANFSLAPKYVAVVKAADLAMYFRYRKIGKKTPFKVDPDSLICVDAEIQRGLIPETGNLRQEEKKINEIRDSILGVSAENPKVFLGTLVWNVRPPAVMSVITVNRDGKPPEYELEIDAAQIWLTDSAHRHIGICEAVKAALIDAAKYPRFSRDFEFPVEIYNLDAAGEKALFKELNSKQKKITAAKAQQVDATSKVGLLKSRIIELDQSGGNRRLLYQNVEVNSNLNERHTLMTMSLLSSSIREMFGNKLINESAEDEDLRESLADYYLKFLYKLSDEVSVTVSLRDKDVAIKPFTNLYLEKILPVEEETAELDDDAIIERRLKSAREDANQLNKSVRDQDKTHSNPVFKALAGIGGYIRWMSNWDKVIENFQSRLMVPTGGRYFQPSNDELLVPRPSGISIATKNEDGKSINIQVVSQVVSEIESLLREKLSLQFEKSLFVEKDDDLTHRLSSAPTYVVVVRRDRRTYVDIRLEFDVGSMFAPEKTQIKMRVTCDGLSGGANWREVEKKGVDRLVPTKFTKVAGYEHPTYATGVARYAANFELDIPEFASTHSGQFQLRLGVEAPSFSGESEETTYVLACQVD
jgi:hypothetical protein